MSKKYLLLLFPFLLYCSSEPDLTVEGTIKSIDAFYLTNEKVGHFILLLDGIENKHFIIKSENAEKIGFSDLISQYGPIDAKQGSIKNLYMTKKDSDYYGESVIIIAKKENFRKRNDKWVENDYVVKKATLPDFVVSKNDILITGMIEKQNNFDLKDTFLQLIPLTEGNNYQVNNASYIFKDGKFITIRYPSEMPELKIMKEGRFTYKISEIQIGQYIIGVQDLTPNFIKYQAKNDSSYFTRAISTENDEFIIIEILEKIYPPFKISLNKVKIPVISENTVIFGPGFPKQKVLKFDHKGIKP